MTTVRDDLRKRKSRLGSAESIGVESQNSFADKSGEYPKKDYLFGSSINKAALGQQVNELFTGGGHPDVSIDLPDQRPSEYPFNQVQETQSGHVIEIDDTPSGERILIKHRTGSGVELRADGSVIISSKRNKVEVTGADQTVIVEGDGNLVYRGNLTVHVTGDYNLKVGGRINVETANDHKEIIGGSKVTEILSDQRTTVQGAQTNTVLENKNEIIYGGYKLNVIDNYQIASEANIDIHSKQSLLTTAAIEWAATSTSINMNGDRVSVIGVSGMIGGDKVHHYGSCFYGPLAGTGLKTQFYGSLEGIAREAKIAGLAHTATTASAALSAADDGGSAYSSAIGPAGGNKAALDLRYGKGGVPILPTELPPIAPATCILTHASEYAFRDIWLDAGYRNYDNTIKLDDYKGLMDHDPKSLNEIRAKLRNYKSNNADFPVVLGDKIGPKWINNVPDDNILLTGRVVTSNPTMKYGSTPLGNSPEDSKSKRFIPKGRI